MDDVNGFIGMAVTYIGDREGDLDVPETRVHLSAYANANVHAGLQLKDLRFNLYANNVIDRRGLEYSQHYIVETSKNTYIPPRTVGLTIVKEF